MSYQILPNIIFIFAILGILLIILRHLPQAALLESKERGEAEAVEKLSSKGLPTKAISSLRALLKVWWRKFLNFLLEAKDLKPSAISGYTIKKIFREKNRIAKQHFDLQAEFKEKENVSVFKDERHYLDKIKNEPKNLQNYDLLGKYYTEKQSFSDSRDIYLYLTSHEPTNPTYHARLAYSLYRLRQFKKASESYEKSLKLDSSQPNRYYNLGLSREAGGDGEGGIEAIRQAIALEPKNSKFYITLANFLIRRGKVDESKTLLEEAIKADPQNPELAAKLKEIM